MEQGYREGRGTSLVSRIQECQGRERDRLTDSLFSHFASRSHNGNDQPQGFGHTCISVPDLEEACARFEKMGVEFKKKPHEGNMRRIAFLFDPDRYWVEVIPQNKKDV